MERQRIARLLPEIFQRTLPAQWWEAALPGESVPVSALGAFLAVMEDLHAPAESAMQNLKMYFDPLQAPDEWLPFLSCWLDLDRFLKQDEKGAWIFPGGPQRLRQLIMEAVSLSKERGTYAGLRRFLKIATGIDQIEITTADRVPSRGGKNPNRGNKAPLQANRDRYHIIVTCTAPRLQDLGMTQAEFHDWVDELVAAEKPAYLTHEVVIRWQAGEPPAQRRASSPTRFAQREG